MFAPGQYAPGTTGGRKLLAHEIAHTIQQATTGTRKLQRKADAGNCAGTGELVDELAETPQGAGAIAHRQIQGFLSPILDSEVPTPRATKRALGTLCPPAGTPLGFIDLWREAGHRRFEIGEIKSIRQPARAIEEAVHYGTRARESVDRLASSGLCGRERADADDRRFDGDWLGHATRTAQAGEPLPTFGLLRGVVPRSPAKVDLGPFWGNPLNKWLRIQSRGPGSVVYWCVNRNLDEEQAVRERRRISRPESENEPLRVPIPFSMLYELHEVFETIPIPVAPQPPGRRIVLTIPDAIYRELMAVREAQRLTRLMRIDPRRNIPLQFRLLWSSTAAVTLGLGTAAAVIAALAPMAIPLATGTTAAGGAAAGGAEVIALAGGATAAQEFAKAAALIIGIGIVGAGASEAHAAGAIQRALANNMPIVPIDITPDPASARLGRDFDQTGVQVGSHWTVGGRPYRVIAILTT